MHAAGWVGITWPKEYGGRGAALIEQVILDEEYARGARARAARHMGLNLVGPDDHPLGHRRAEAPLPAARSSTRDEIWCQGFSEPGAGSDLAGLRTRAEDRGDHFVVNGQKVWTSGAHFADWIILLVRTDPDAPKHKGITCLLVDMKTPGITRAAAGADHRRPPLQRGLLRGRRVPAGQLLGPVNQGWKVATTTLMYERHASGAPQPDRPGARASSRRPTLPLDGGTAWDDPIRQRLAQLAIDCEALKYTRFRSLTRQLRGEPPGPEGSILKLSGSELGVRIADAAGELLGLHALVNQGTRAGARRAALVQPRCSPRGSTRSRAAPARSSATSSASACSGCRRAEAAPGRTGADIPIRGLQATAFAMVAEDEPALLVRLLLGPLSLILMSWTSSAISAITLSRTVTRLLPFRERSPRTRSRPRWGLGAAPGCECSFPPPRCPAVATAYRCRRRHP